MNTNEMLKVVVLSGGSGNDALIKGLKQLFGQEKKLDIKVIVNAYDNGKSTGVCRAVTDMLGVSDIRKNHERMYEIIHGEEGNLPEFFSKRFNFTRGNERKEIESLLKQWNLSQYSRYVRGFFDSPVAHEYEYKDFVVANIVYAQMFREIGYEKTNKHFCDMLGIDDFVVLNSFDNVFIKAVTQSGHIIADEGDIVCWNNPDDIIVDVFFDVRNDSYGLNPAAVKLVKNADLILISTGTFWSSLQPTVKYLDFYKYINASHAKKIWILNNDKDGDSYGVSSLQFVGFMEETGLDLSDFTILVNSEAETLLRQIDDRHNFEVRNMGNLKGKHCPELFARAVLDVYFGLIGKFDTVIFDFDDTLWSRETTESAQKTSIENLCLLQDRFCEKTIIVSGNSFDSIRRKILQVYESLSSFHIPIWADANSTLYLQGKKINRIDKCVLSQESVKSIMAVVDELGITDKTVIIDSDGVVNIKIKPLADKVRDDVCSALNDSDNNYLACKTGKTTVDVLSKNNNKSIVLDYIDRHGRILYVGDETYMGNDVVIAGKCSAFCQVKSVFETNILLRLLEKYL